MKFSASLASIAAITSVCQASALRAANNGRRLDAEYNELTAYLNDFFGTGACDASTAVFDGETTTTFYCTMPGIEATLVADGDASNPLPASLTVCVLGTKGTKSCRHVHRLDARADPVKNAALLLDQQFDAIDIFLNDHFQNNCQDFVTNGIPPKTQVKCSNDGAEATLIAEGTMSDSTPEYVTFCTLVSGGQQDCQTVHCAPGKNCVRDVKKMILGQ